MHVIAAKAVAFGEALGPEFKTYIDSVINNAKASGSIANSRLRHRNRWYRYALNAG